MNAYSTTKIVIDKLDTNILVNTISFEKTQDLDLNKENIYILVNVDLVSSIIGDSRNQFKYIISILNQRDLDNVFNNDKIFSDNYIDNINECHTVANLMINQIRSNASDELDLVSVSEVNILSLVGSNMLDGVRFEIIVEVDNDLSC